MKTRNIKFKKGMELKLHSKSEYGEEYDEIIECIVDNVRNYKRGQKLNCLRNYKDQRPIGFGIWVNEYPFEIEVV